MTIEQIKEEYNRLFGRMLSDERIVDVDLYEAAGETYVTFITVTVKHIVWKRWFYIENGELHFIRCECM